MIERLAPQQDFEGMAVRRERASTLFAKDITRAHVARELEVSRQSVSRWHDAWSCGGAMALNEAGREGRKPLLDSSDLAKVETALQYGPRALTFAADIWTLPTTKVLIATLTGVTNHSGHVWRGNGKLGWSPQRPARRSLERDNGAIDEWVATGLDLDKKTSIARTLGWSSMTNHISR